VGTPPGASCSEALSDTFGQVLQNCLWDIEDGSPLQAEQWEIVPALRV